MNETNDTDISAMINDLEDFANKTNKKKNTKNLLKVTLQPNKSLKTVPQEELFSFFEKTFLPDIKQELIKSDASRIHSLDDENDPEITSSSMSFNFVNDVKVYSRYYLKQLEFAYFMKTGKNLMVVSKNSDTFLAPISMIFHINNFLAFYSFRAMSQLHSDILHTYNVLQSQGYCGNDSDDKNTPSLSLGIKQTDTSFSLDCMNNFMDIDAPIVIKQELYFNLIKNFIKNILDNLSFKFVEINNSKTQDFVDIYPSFLENKSIFLKHLTEQLFNNKI